jgi:hypothetical protein
LAENTNLSGDCINLGNKMPNAWFHVAKIEMVEIAWLPFPFFSTKTNRAEISVGCQIICDAYYFWMVLVLPNRPFRQEDLGHTKKTLTLMSTVYEGSRCSVTDCLLVIE